MSAATRLSVSGMSCAGCVASVEQAIKSVDGVMLAPKHWSMRFALPVMTRRSSPALKTSRKKKRQKWSITANC